MLPNLQAIVEPDDDGIIDTMSFGPSLTNADLIAIPSFDLPFGVPNWQGQNGGHSKRNGNKEIVWSAP